MTPMAALLVAVLAVVPALPCGAISFKITPTQQVISMLTEMKAKGAKMLGDEQKLYAAYAEWVDDETKRLGFEVQEGASKAEELAAFAAKADSDAQQLGGEVSALDAEIDKLSAEKKEATDLRQKDHAEYLKMSEDYAESVDALERAIQVLSAQSYDRAQAEVLLQRMSATVPGMPRVLAAFLQEKGHGSLRGDNGAPEVAAYEFQSGGVVELLEGLLKKFKVELAGVEEAESNQAHAFALMELHLSDSIARDQSDRDEKAVARGKTAAASANAKGELAATKAEQAADEQLRSDMEATFKVKTAAFEGNQRVRAEELEAIGKAIEIISSPAVAGSYAKRVNLAQVAKADKGASLLQLGRSRRRVGARERVAEFLSKRARALDSKTLAAAAAQIAANPFAKVIGMVESLLAKLKAEAGAEAEHKGWCDEQLKTNKLKRETKTSEANKLMAEVEGLDASIADMGATVATLANEQAALTQAMGEATQFRQKESAENKEAIADAAAGMEAIGRALVILKEFYSSQASLLQQVPEMAAYKGMQTSEGGVIGMLEVIESDFARLKADTEASEAAAAKEYASFMTESQLTQLRKHEAEVKLRLDKDQAEYERGVTEKDLLATQDELDKATVYFQQLRPSCLEVKVSYAERVAKRGQELEALKEAYAILDQKTAA